MNKLQKLAAAFAAIFMIVIVAHAFSVPTHVLQYFGSGVGSTTSIFDLDGNGNVVITGGLTVNGKIASTTDGSFGGTGITSAILNTPVTINSVLGLFPRTLAQINVLGGFPAGNVVYCSNCTRSYICVSSATNAGAWVIAVETGTMVGTPTHCS